MLVVFITKSYVKPKGKYINLGEGLIMSFVKGVAPWQRSD